MNDAIETARARRALGRQLAQFRQAAGFTQHQLAPRTLYGRSTIANVEIGRQNVPRGFWERADAVLSAGGALLARYDDLVRLRRHERRGIATASADGFVGGEEDDGVLGALLARPAAVADRHRHGRITDPVDIQRSELLLNRFLQLDAQVGGDDLYQPMTRHVARLTQVAAASPKSAPLRSLGQLSQLTGWLALDSNRHGAARRYFTTAIYAANEVDDPALAASTLAYLSLQATYRNDPKQALSLASTAVQVVGAAATPLVRTMLATRLARAQARLGNRRECLAALDVAHVAFARAGNAKEPPWISYVDEIEVKAQAGASYLDLEMYARAEESLCQALLLLEANRPERVRDHVHYLSRLAQCRLRAGEVDLACHTGLRSVDLALTVASARVVERIGEFDVAIGSVETSAADDFRERFAVLSGAH